MLCVICGQKAFTAYCFRHKPRKLLKTARRIRRVGKVGKKQMDFNKSWLVAVPDNKLYCFYCKHIGIHRLLDRSEA